MIVLLLFFGFWLAFLWFISRPVRQPEDSVTRFTKGGPR